MRTSVLRDLLGQEMVIVSYAWMENSRTSLEQLRAYLVLPTQIQSLPAQREPTVGAILVTLGQMAVPVRHVNRVNTRLLLAHSLASNVQPASFLRHSVHCHHPHVLDVTLENIQKFEARCPYRLAVIVRRANILLLYQHQRARSAGLASTLKLEARNQLSHAMTAAREDIQRFLAQCPSLFAPSARSESILRLCQHLCA